MEPEIPAKLQDYIKQLGCGFCGTPSGRGFIVNPSPEDGGVWLLSTRCLRCGVAGFMRLVPKRPEPPPAPAVSDISTDEVIDQMRH
jgi:hypothetical protein